MRMLTLNALARVTLFYVHARRGDQCTDYANNNFAVHLNVGEGEERNNQLDIEREYHTQKSWYNRSIPFVVEFVGQSQAITMCALSTFSVRKRNGLNLTSILFVFARLHYVS